MKFIQSQDNMDTVNPTTVRIRLRTGETQWRKFNNRWLAELYVSSIPRRFGDVEAAKIFSGWIDSDPD